MSTDRKRWPFVVGALGLTSCGGCIALLIHLDKVEEQLSPLGPACEGKPVAIAKAFTKNSPHAITVFHRHETERWRADVNKTDENEPEKIDALVCIDKKDELPVGSCSFYRTKLGFKIPGSDHTYKRTLAVYSVKVVEAKTGRELGAGKIWGDLPIRCETYSGKRPSDSSFAGDEPSKDAIWAWTQELFVKGVAPTRVPSLEPEDGDGEASGADDEVADDKREQ